jgi:hypothetical protein
MRASYYSKTPGATKFLAKFLTSFLASLLPVGYGKMLYNLDEKWREEE